MPNLYYRNVEPKVHFEKPNLPSPKECYEYMRQFLSNFDFITIDDINNITTYWEYFHLPKNEILVKKGEICSYMYFIVKGSFVKYIEDDRGKHIILFVTETNICGSAKSFHFKLPSQQTISTTENVYGLKISHENYLKMVAEKPVYNKLFILLLDETIDYLMHRIRRLLSLNAKERYEQFLKQYPDVYQRFNLQDISNFLGITPETLSRLRKIKKGK